MKKTEQSLETGLEKSKLVTDLLHSSHLSISDLSHEVGRRLDTVVASLIPGCSRSYAADLIRKGSIRVRGTVKKPAYRLKAGDEIRGHIPSPEPLHFEPEPIEIDILYEDGHLIVINKQPGLVVHPAPGHYSGTLVNGLLYHCPDLEGIGGKLRPGIVHRLDKDTSGTLIVAKNAVALESLALQFKSRTIRKKYLAMVHGEIRGESGVISLPVGRHPVHRKKMSTFSRKGRPAETLWKVRERFQGAALLDIDLKTGRTHQIRVHCAAINHPVIGDDVYCGRRTGSLMLAKLSHLLKKEGFRQMLHAWQLEFVHPVSEKTMRFESPVPADMSELIDALRNED